MVAIISGLTAQRLEPGGRQQKVLRRERLQHEPRKCFFKRRQKEHCMITATVRYQLPAHIDYNACLAHFSTIAPGFRETRSLIGKHFICSESGWDGEPRCSDGSIRFRTKSGRRSHYHPAVTSVAAHTK